MRRPPRLRILVLADAVNAELGQQLTPRGFEVASACTPDEALREISAYPPQLVLAEVDDAGTVLALLEATCARLQQDQQRPPVLASVSSDAIQHRLGAFAPWLHAVLRQPYPMAVLIDAVCRAVLHHAFAHGRADARLLRALGFTHARQVRRRPGIAVRRVVPEVPDDS